MPKRHYKKQRLEINRQKLTTYPHKNSESQLLPKIYLNLPRERVKVSEAAIFFQRTPRQQQSRACVSF